MEGRNPRLCESLFDALTYKLPAGTSAADRARMQVLAMATATLSQGPSLSQAGSDLLRSKSLDRNSFDPASRLDHHSTQTLGIPPSTLPPPSLRSGNGLSRAV